MWLCPNKCSIPYLTDDFHFDYEWPREKLSVKRWVTCLLFYINLGNIVLNYITDLLKPEVSERTHLRTRDSVWGSTPCEGASSFSGTAVTKGQEDWTVLRSARSTSYPEDEQAEVLNLNTWPSIFKPLTELSIRTWVQKIPILKKQTRRESTRTCLLYGPISCGGTCCIGLEF